jgi:hypothetical protein
LSSSAPETSLSSVRRGDVVTELRLFKRTRGKRLTAQSQDLNPE